MTSGVLPVFSRLMASASDSSRSITAGMSSRARRAARSRSRVALCASSAPLIHDEPGPSTRSTWIGAGN